MGVRLVLVLLMFLVSTGDHQSSYLYCTRGEYLDQKGHENCMPCEMNTYMDEDHHRNTKCRPCSKVDAKNPYYDVLHGCNATHDANYECHPNYYKHSHFPDEPCMLCTDCSSIGQFLAKACTQTEDSVCCPKEGMKLKDGVCEESMEIGTVTNDDDLDKTKDRVDADANDDDKAVVKKSEFFPANKVFPVVLVVVFLIFLICVLFCVSYKRRQADQQNRLPVESRAQPLMGESEV
ncbi:hypothetical protein PoB_005212600 [Plakobranchus ocellatus]|uniref:TNFR-Cys domain-containing protein n=1 Tax=Plakobranchus ocellatus TaxID=259542 RepID=A0AAV4C2L2_9GAST|nr:hypothetical protein PoB_005212600 [Plakobranchus ocellatus]